MIVNTENKREKERKRERERENIINEDVITITDSINNNVGIERY